MQPPTSPSLLGVRILTLDATGPEYSRWRRSVRFALETKNGWKYCNGRRPMPMPKATPAIAEPNDIQPSLLQERREWVRRDREVKLDIFQSLAEEVMQDVFGVGPPLPPTQYTAQQMLQALDNRFSVFEFEGYHHAFCHFLNLHVDQYENLDDFNKEFLTVLEDLHDYGHPISNVQACSAYFSKLQCTQNPWVAKKVAEWDVQPFEPQLCDLMQAAVLWPCTKSLASNSWRDCFAKPSPEEHIDDGAAPGPTYSDLAPELSDTSTLSSKASHSREMSELISERQIKTAIHLSNRQFDPKALCEALERIPAIVGSERPSLDQGIRTDPTTPEWLSARESIDSQPPMQKNAGSESTDIPILLLPPAALHKPDSNPHMRSLSTPIPEIALSNPTIPEKSPRRKTTDFSFKQAIVSIQASQKPPSLSEHPAFRNRAWSPPETITADLHPALRPMTPLLKPQKPKPKQKERSCSPLDLSRSKPPPPLRNHHRRRARSVGNFSAQDTTSSFLPPPSSTTASGSSSTSTVFTLPLQGSTLLSIPDTTTPPCSQLSSTCPLPPYNPTPPLPPPSPVHSPSPSQKPLPFLPFPFIHTHTRSPSAPPLPTQRPVQPPVSKFSLSPTPDAAHKDKHARSGHRRFRSTGDCDAKARNKAGYKSGKEARDARDDRKKEKEKEKKREKGWSLGVGRMGKLGGGGGKGEEDGGDV
ncbi:hypothetical protein COCMIDRAFT_99354 [Bipolaris oryzae ATCC 44560]|uniref:Retrotransposon Copia-like N-terminal domain-containing protein n=1 Tax=Bipolaris oryzae ATCC 44560 TaxID=930090 RepID=W6ZK97_COCMI|nr:uncharacterized protein COCMIDRAFT_99354 [Bipolaris oryzae ATCC 44560]EUC44006.1 hypothetical protein COCMIDRAFT_99354 [Bipolaris oryzae ATCC 44560]